MSKVMPRAASLLAARAKALPASSVWQISSLVERGIENRRGSGSSFMRDMMADSLSIEKAKPELRTRDSASTFVFPYSSPGLGLSGSPEEIQKSLRRSP